ncbi:matrix protein 2-2 [Avian metapneumovirus type D]|uniref:Matrix protein 2-2 n=1 Tax=Avian metapneumovirus type D TaxID=519376 RepID=A0A077SJ11_9MONO|nr:matrix protein 2-2 [Avian metapneumovirus type D]
MPVAIPCRRVTAVIKCNRLGVCMMRRFYDHSIISLGDLIEVVANMIILDHINLRKCQECRKDFDFVAIYTSYN